ncbi:MAG: hypothetical protein RIE56_01150 [Amphiplicatus sp.]
MKKPVGYFLGEGVLIVFSILLALGVNEWRVRAGEAAEERKATADIAAELTENRALLDGLPDYHREIGQALSAVAGGLDPDEARTPMEIFSNLDMLQRSVIISRLPQNVAWQIAKDRGVTARFDYETAKALALVYNQQENVVSTYDKLSDLLIRPEMFAARDQTSTLAPLGAAFSELAARELALINLLNESAVRLNGEAPKN